MAIKINGQDLVKRMINGQEVEKVMLNGSQIWPDVIPPTPVVDYLCFTANTANSTIALTERNYFTPVTLEISSDKNTWTTYTLGDTITLVNIGDKVYWRSSSITDTGFSTTDYHYTFSMTGSIAGSGNITTLLNKNGTDTLSSYCFYGLFEDCSSLTTAPSLPATTLANGCYSHLFEDCESLTTAPSLPATTLADSCYYSMFSGCDSLTTVPSLPATTLANRCYHSMFQFCHSLITLPELPAINLPDYCYNSMFYYCSNIKISQYQVPEYPNPYRIPSSGTGVAGVNPLTYMFNGTGGSYTSPRPSINTTYYTSNTIIS